MTDKEFKRAEKKLLLRDLRDQYAGHAMQGLLAARVELATPSEGTMKMISETSWKMAAAMLKARS